MTVEKAQNTSEKGSAKMICEACGAEFWCGASVGICWCFAVEVPPENLTVWREKYKSCVCEDCLSGVKKTRPTE